VPPVKSAKKKVVTRFMADRDAQYREFISKCADSKAEIAKETAAGHFTDAEIEESDRGEPIRFYFLLFEWYGRQTVSPI
jgi:hypothetical protein